MASVRLLLNKKREIIKMQKTRGFSQQTWGSISYTSESTVKRFLRGNSISIDAFQAICEALGIQEWQMYVDWEDNDSTQITSEVISSETMEGISPSAKATSEEPDAKPSALVVSATFSEEDQQEIEAVLEHLKSLMLRCSITIRPGC